MLKDILF